jgi:hypothetical protein
MSWLSNASIYERRRVAVALVVTLVLVPVAWWSQRSPATERPEGTATEEPVSENLPPGFLSGSKETTPNTTALTSVQPVDNLIRTGMATYKNFGVKGVKPPGPTTSTIVPPTVLPKDVCILNFLPEGTKVFVENTDNGRSVACHVRWQTIPAGMIVVLNAPLFQKISELTQAPIPVRISW